MSGQSASKSCQQTRHIRQSLPRCALAITLTLALASVAYPAEVQSAAADETLSKLLQAKLVASLPPAFEQSVDWGATIQMFDGWEWQRDGGRRHLETRKKDVRHGKWELHRATIIDPSHRLLVRVANVRPIGPGRIGLDVLVTAPVHGESRLERWRYGVKLFNYAAEAEGTLQIRVSAEVGFHFERDKLLGKLVIDPRVTAVQLGLDGFELQRIGRFDGPAVQGLGKTLSGVLDKQLRAQETRVVEQLNAGIASRPDKLRFSLDDLLGLKQWTVGSGQ